MCEIAETPPPFSIETMGNGKARLMRFCEEKMCDVPYYNQYGKNPQGDVSKIGRVADWYNTQEGRGV